MSFDPITMALSKGGGGLPFVELEMTFEINEGDTELPESDAAKLNEIYNSGTKCFVASFGVAGHPYFLNATFSAVLTAVNLDGIDAFLGVMSLATGHCAYVSIAAMEGQWLGALISGGE